MQTGNRQQATGSWQLRKGSDLANRLVEFAVVVLKISSELPKTVAGRQITSQLVRAATSAGANYQEARAAESNADFIHKVRIAAKEAREAAYWLQLAHRANLAPKASATLQSCHREACEVTAILVASARTAREREG
jgi:four helix bundle protein